MEKYEILYNKNFWLYLVIILFVIILCFNYILSTNFLIIFLFLISLISLLFGIFLTNEESNKLNLVMNILFIIICLLVIIWSSQINTNNKNYISVFIIIFSAIMLNINYKFYKFSNNIFYFYLTFLIIWIIIALISMYIYQ